MVQCQLLVSRFACVNPSIGAKRKDEHKAEELVHGDDRVGPAGPDGEAQQYQQDARAAQGHVNSGGQSIHRSIPHNRRIT